MYSAQTQQKGINRMASPISLQDASERASARSHLHVPIAQHPVTACPYVACTGPSHYAHTGLSSQRSSQTQLGLAIACLETQCCNVLPHRRLVEVFRSKVTRVLRVFLPPQQNLFLGDVFLEPQRSRLQVSDLAHAPSRTNSTCCGSVTCHVSSQISPQVSAQVLQANDSA